MEIKTVEQARERLEYISRNINDEDCPLRAWRALKVEAKVLRYVWGEELERADERAP